MKINIFFFGLLSDIANDHRLSIEMGAHGNTHELQRFLHQRFPGLKQHKYLLAINQKVVKSATELKEGDEVALLPPYAGG